MTRKQLYDAVFRITFRRVVIFMVFAGLFTLYLLYFTPAKRAAAYRLWEADQKSNAAKAKHLNALSQMFSKGRNGSRRFATEALSWGGKWALVKNTIGLGERGEYKQYLSDLFARHVFSEAELQKALERTVKTYLIDLEGAESEMLVRLRADLADLDSSKLPMLQSDHAFKQHYQDLANKVAPSLKLDLGVTVGREIGVLVASEVATQVALQAARAGATEMGVEAGILGAGAASTVATLGIGLVIAVIIDYVVDIVFKWSGYDPVAKIEKEVDTALNKMEASLIGQASFFGGGKDGTLRREMEKLHESRSNLRREVVAQMLKGGK